MSMSNGVEDPFNQKIQLKKCMEGLQENTWVSINSEVKIQSGIDTSLITRDSSPKGRDIIQELELSLQTDVERSPMVTDSYVEGPVSINTGLEEWVTPECILSNLSECHIIGNKMKSFLTEESQHSKWEEFRRMAKSETANEECSQLLRRMELQESDEEEDGMMEDLNSQEELVTQAEELEEQLRRKRQKKQIQWGPVQRMDRPRRHPKDGKTIAQRAEELKIYKNLCNGTKPSLIITSESNDNLIANAKCVNISLGTDDNMVASNIDLIRDKDLAGRRDFLEKNPEINLPTDLNVELNIEEFPSLVKEKTLTTSSPLKEMETIVDKSWVKITSKGLKPSTSNINNDDRSNMEC